MVDSCSSFGCTNIRQLGSDIHFHQFPLNRPDVLKKWIQATQRKDYTPSKISYFCSDHFNPSDYQTQPGSDEKILLDDAVPSIFKGFPENVESEEVDENYVSINGQCANNSLLPEKPDLKTYDYQNLTASSIVTCGNCKKQMTFKEYDSKHRSVHYNLCWLDGIQDEIDFFDTPKLQTPLRKMPNKNRFGRQLKYKRRNEINRTRNGLINHLNASKYNILQYINCKRGVQFNTGYRRKDQMGKKIKILQQCLKQKEAKIKLLRGLIADIKSEIMSSYEVAMTHTDNLEISHEGLADSTSNAE